MLNETHAQTSNDLVAPRTPKGVATRERLLSAAHVVFGNKGYEQTRVADIVAIAKVSHGLFYRHFADKNAILYAVLTSLNDGLRHSTGRAAGGTRLPTIEQLTRRNILFFREYSENRLMLRVAREAAARTDDSGFRALWIGIRGRFVARTLRWIEELIESRLIAPIHDPPMIAEGLCALTEQMAYVQVGLAENEPDDATIERLGGACAVMWHRIIVGSTA